MSDDKQPQRGTQCVWAGEDSYLMQGATQVRWCIVSRTIMMTLMNGWRKTEDLITDLRQALDF